MTKTGIPFGRYFSSFICRNKIFLGKLRDPYANHSSKYRMIRERVDSKTDVTRMEAPSDGFLVFLTDVKLRHSKIEFHYERSRHRWLLWLSNGLFSLECRRTKKRKIGEDLHFLF